MTLSASGVFAFARKPRGKREREMALLVKAIQHGILTDYASGGMRPSLKDRLQPSGLAVYGLSPRSTKYRIRQIKTLGVIRPYFSPRRMNFARLALATTKGNAQQMIRATEALTRFKPHMADIIHKPGIGFNVRHMGGRNVRSSITYPVARKLNSDRNKKYRKELTNLTLGGGRDRRALLRELSNRTRDLMPRFYAKNQRVRLVS